jgi:hypothetical protein
MSEPYVMYVNYDESVYPLTLFPSCMMYMYSSVALVDKSMISSCAIYYDSSKGVFIDHSKP